ncbi:low affinity immunoglobulin gamma Fc region receptor III-A-like [Epinephelus fuscoguttatus]|uniref:low affinity immunoglobulin gamma Fc region receptor III-A-like n=1 Tax=Epinephelus fuscoguttatus TaxID=293821 RepID=UPI0020D15C2D|nr:low affinity immunoglobulin gamma Fc region receptor III-A-like [Epinephelus fuscoguttatus]
MEVTALCVTLLVTVFLQRGAHAQRVDEGFWIVPTRLQLFEYEPVSFKCISFDGSTGWNISRKGKTGISTCGVSKWGTLIESSCTIRGAFQDDSGEYWCEAGGGKRSNSVNVTVSAGSVILESPALPVMEGDDVTLRCRNKTTSSTLTAEFFKDGRLMRSSSTGNMTINSVSKSDEGLYRCRISGAGESPESQLAVTAPHAESHPSSDHTILIFRNIIPLVLMAPLLLLLLLALLHSGKLRGKQQNLRSTQNTIKEAE